MHKRLLYIMLILLFACGQKKLDFSGATPLKAKDFLSVFPIINNTFFAADSNFLKLSDSTRIGLKAITQFIPDSVIANLVGKEKNPAFYPVGKIVKEKETYLLLNIIEKHRKLMALIVVDTKSNKCLASKRLIEDDLQDEYVHTITVNKEPTFLLAQEKMGKDNIAQFTRIGWVYSSGIGFMIVVNDSNESPSKSNIINPIDTLPRKNRYSGDYAEDKRNFISLRDGKNANSYAFFIHFEKNEGTCIGELKGELKMKDLTNGQYRFNTDPCVIDFKFEGNQISLKEQGTCGNHRGIKCFFDDQFTRKKESKSNKRK
ncbi:MAG: hypothetical protein K2Q21_03395 [Chitinophagaceae bacterium]|nr:hypothetical protein [Chitinophagaceae bacterium]